MIIFTNRAESKDKAAAPGPLQSVKQAACSSHGMILFGKSCCFWWWKKRIYTDTSEAGSRGRALLSSREGFCCAVRQCDCLEWLNYLRLRPQKAVAETSQAITSSGRRAAAAGFHLTAKRAPPPWNRSLRADKTHRRARSHTFIVSHHCFGPSGLLFAVRAAHSVGSDRS
jgi:hypothetical protein